jgi:hypothetical protein
LRADDLSGLSVDAVDGLLSGETFRVESEDALLDCLLELGSAYSPLLRHIQPAFLSPDGLSALLDHLAHPPESAWASLAARLRTPPGPPPPPPGPRSHVAVPPAQAQSRGWLRSLFRPAAAPPPPPPASFSSLIVSEFPKIFAEFRAKRFSLLWRGSRDGFRARDFHSRCDGHANTLTVILDTDGNVFGGFTPVEWDSTSHEKADDSLRSFVFTLKNPHNIPPRRFALKSEPKRPAIYCDFNWGPHFCGIGVSNLRNCCWTELGLAYTNDTGLDGKMVFTGSHRFRVREIEVFEITE